MDEDEQARERYMAMLAAIGQVSLNSAQASQQVQQLVAVVTGTDLTYFMLEDLTMGAQIGHAKAILSKANTEHVRHPHLEPQVQDLGLFALSALGQFTKKRNRVVHDTWRVDPTEEWPDGLEGRRATRYGKAVVHTSVSSLHRLASAISTASAMLSSVQLAVTEWRPAPPDTIEGRYFPPGSRTRYTREARGKRDKLETTLSQMQSGRLPRWRWEEVPWGSPPVK